MFVIKVNGTVIGKVTSNRSLTLEEAMWSIGYDIDSQEDCKNGYEKGVEGFCFDDGIYYFDVESADFYAE